jgi:hypothetical protein
MGAENSPLVPWFRQPWPWILIAIPFSSVCVGSYYIYQAVHGQDPMVQEQYYAAGQSINKVLAAGKNAERLGLHGQLQFNGERLELALANPQRVVLAPVLTLQLSHPTIARLDQTVTLVASTPGHYSGQLKPTDASRWDVTLLPADHGWSLSGRWLRDEGATAQLSPTDVREAQN